MLFKLSLFVFSLLTLVGIFVAQPARVSAATFEEQVVSIINSERQKQKLPTLATSDKLFQASLNHNTVMATCAKSYSSTTCFVHTVSVLKEAGLLSRIQSTGYNPQAVSENIAWGYTTPASVVSAWMNSAGHRANILGNYKDVGCDYLDSLKGSYKGMYWTCDFGRSFSSSNPSPTPTARVSATPTPIKSVPTLKPTATPTSIPMPTRFQIPTVGQPIITPTPTISSETSPTPAGQSAIPTITEAPTGPTPTPKPWWCIYVPADYPLCN